MGIKAETKTIDAPAPWHAIEPQTAADRLDGDAPQSLSGNETTRRRGQLGPNRPTPKKGKSAILLFLRSSTIR